MTRRQSQSISEMARLVDCYWSAVVRIYQQSSKVGQTTNWQQGIECPRLIDAQGQQRLSHLVRANRRSTIAQVTQNCNDVPNVGSGGV